MPAALLPCCCCCRDRQSALQSAGCSQGRCTAAALTDRPIPSPPQPDHFDKGYTPRIPGERLSSSYINHYKANGGAVLSKFGAGAAMADQRALDILGEAYCK